MNTIKRIDEENEEEKDNGGYNCDDFNNIKDRIIASLSVKFSYKNYLIYKTENIISLLSFLCNKSEMNKSECHCIIMKYNNVS
jgi:hypothetical protein